MASPQKENGYTAIANELLEKFCCPGISGSEYRILLTVLRKTYGFQKKKDYIALSQFSKETGGMKRSNAVEAIKSLVAKRILVKEESTYSINKNWEEWVVVKRIHGSQLHTKSVMQKHNKVVAKSIHTKETIQKKERNTSEASSPFDWKVYLAGMHNSSRIDIQLIGYYFERRKLSFSSKQEAEIAIRRHLRAAKDVSVFEKKRVFKAMDECDDLERKKGVKWSLETVIKYLTK